MSNEKVVICKGDKSRFDFDGRHYSDVKNKHEAKLFHPHRRHAGQLVAEVNDGHGDELPSDSPVPQEL